jgi:hypothetical protein
MFGMKPLELILLIAVGYLIWDKFKAKPVASAGAGQVLNGASQNTAPNIIENGSQVGDNFDLQVEDLTRNLGY